MRDRDVTHTLAARGVERRAARCDPSAAACGADAGATGHRDLPGVALIARPAGRRSRIKHHELAGLRPSALVHARGTTQTDIYRYEIASGATTRITNTPEGEYSPTVTPDGAHISVIRVEADGTQRLWRFTLDGREPALVLERVKPVGYHAWADDHMLALFVLGSPATLQLADTRSGNAETVARGINRSLQRIPHTGTISFVDKDANGSLMVRELDPKTRNVTTLVAAVAGAKEADLAWTPDGLLMMAEKDILYSWRRNDVAWTRVADLGAVGMHGVTRIAVSPKGDRIAFVGAP
jgi:hypothetical protein